MDGPNKSYRIYKSQENIYNNLEQKSNENVRIRKGRKTILGIIDYGSRYSSNS